MELFKTDDIEKYQEERERRKKIYDEICAQDIPNDQSVMVERIKKLDEAYLDFHDKVIFEL
jgi:hypothetical protein